MESMKLDRNDVWNPSLSTSILIIVFKFYEWSNGYSEELL